MRQKIKILTLVVVSSLVAGLSSLPANVGAVNVFEEACSNSANADSVICKNKDDNADSVIKNIINTLLYVVGALSVIMLIYGGIRYTTSAGNANGVTAAKNTITYAIVGLVVASLAYVIVNWVLNDVLK